MSAQSRCGRLLSQGGFDSSDASSRRRMGAGDSCAGLSPAKRSGKLLAVAEPDDALVGLEFSRAAHPRVQRLSCRKARREDPRQDAEHPSDDVPRGIRQGRIFCKRSSCSNGHVVQEVAETGNGVDRQREPLIDRERNRVRAEVMAQFVCKYPAQLLVCEILSGVARHDDEVASTSEGVDVVVIDDTDDVAPALDVPRLGDLVECFLQFGRLGTRRTSRSDEKSQQSALRPGQEEQDASGEIADHHPPGGDIGERSDGKPEDDHGHEPQRNDGQRGDEGEKRRSVDVTMPSRRALAVPIMSRVHRNRVLAIIDIVSLQLHSGGQFGREQSCRLLRENGADFGHFEVGVQARVGARSVTARASSIGSCPCADAKASNE